ncbi:MAG: protein kinase, partial [Gammaproteobacteria bacterium]|nr:protein kinase [Gammaproteobacteria bacterium]
MTFRILLLEPNRQFASLIAQHIKTVWREATVERCKDLKAAVRVAANYSLLVADYDTLVDGQPPGSTRQLDWLSALLKTNELPTTIVVAEPSDEFKAVACIKAGASDFLAKRRLTHPIFRESLIEAVRPPVDAAPPAPPKILRRADDCPTIEGYNVTRALGAGAMASVFLADSEELGEQVVLKVMWRRQGRDQEELFARFEREYELIAKSNTKEIVDIFDFGVEPGFAYITMEYFPCGDLRTRMRNPVS